MVLGTEQVGQIAEDDVQTMFDTNVLGLISLTQIFVNGELCATFLSISIRRSAIRKFGEGNGSLLMSKS